MLQTIKLVVLHHTRYRETSAIIQGYSDQTGRIHLVVNSIFGQKSKYSPNLIRPLNLLEAVIYYRENKELHRVTDLKPIVPLQEIQFDIYKGTQAIFLAEVLYRVLKEEEKNQELFDFLMNAINLLEFTEKNASLFHLLFLIKLSRYLGFYPSDNYLTGVSYFDLKDGHFNDTIPYHPAYLDRETSRYFRELIRCPLHEIETLSIPRPARVKLLDAIVNYYQLHVHGAEQIKSLAVLREVFKD